jgi:hypothetical protein
MDVFSRNRRKELGRSMLTNCQAGSQLLKDNSLIQITVIPKRSSDIEDDNKRLVGYQRISELQKQSSRKGSINDDLYDHLDNEYSLENQNENLV